MELCNGNELNNDHNKWSEWTMRPKKREAKLTDYASGFVIALATFVVCGAPQYLITLTS